MAEPTEAEQEAARAGIYANPDTPGYHLANVGGGIAGLGSFVSLCTRCGALIGNTDNVRAVHDRWHELIVAVAAEEGQ